MLRGKLKLVIQRCLQFSDPIFKKEDFLASDWTAKKRQHGSKQISGIYAVQGYMLLLKLTKTRFSSDK